MLAVVRYIAMSWTRTIARADGPLEGMINSLSVAVTNFQPLNDGKKWLAKVQAGDYAEGEMSAKLDQYIQNNPVHKPHALPQKYAEPNSAGHWQHAACIAEHAACMVEHAFGGLRYQASITHVANVGVSAPAD